MTEFEGLYTAVIESGPKEIKQYLTKIPTIHQQEALDSALEKSITLSAHPKTSNIKHLLELGANPNGSSEDAGIILSYAYTFGLEEIIELLLQAGANVNAPHSDVLEQAVRKGDAKYVVRFVEAGGDINNKKHLLYVDDLLTTASRYSKIQKYLISKGIKSATPELAKKLDEIETPTIDDFEYKVQEMECVTKQVFIKDHSARYLIILGNTKPHQTLIRKHGGRFIRGKGWLIPKSRREAIEKELYNIMSPLPKSSSSPVASATPVYSVSPEQSPDELDIIKNTSNNTIVRPSVKSETINLYTPISEYGFMTIAYSIPNLFNLDSKMWDSIERYLMYKMYEGTFKGKALSDAETLAEARKKFYINKVFIAKTPKQLVLNQKLVPLAQSEINKRYLQNREDIFYLANKAKFTQNRVLRNRLLKTANREIIDKNPDDFFGYEGNLLGNTLMRLRHEFGGSEYIVKKTNNLIIEKYSPNKSFYVIRGDSELELASVIRGLGIYKTKAGKTVRGKLNFNLQGGPGWLIPVSRADEAKKVVFETFPDEKKIRVSGQDWIKKRVRKFIDVALLFSQLRDRQEIGSDDVMFAIKDVFGTEEFLGEDGELPADHFVQSVWKYVDGQGAVISEAAIKLLWDFMSKMVKEFTNGIETFQQMKKIMNRIEAAILDTSIQPVEGLTERENIIISSFTRLYKLLKRVHNKEAKICVTAIHMMLSKHHYENIREIYSKKAKMQGNEYPDEETQFRKRFHIKTPHIEAVLQKLSDISKKCKLLVLTTLDYVMNLEGENAITISKRLIILSQKGKQPSPTPQTPSPPPADNSNIPKLPLDGSEPMEEPVEDEH